MLIFTMVGVYLSIRFIEADPKKFYYHLNPTALRKAKIVYNFGLSECNRFKKVINIQLCLWGNIFDYSQLSIS